MTIMRPSAGWTANWMFEPPVSTPISRMIATAASRIVWYSRSVRVWTGATVIESPVWMPIGSKFSIEQMMTTLSLQVAHDLQFELLPPEDRLLDEDLVDGAGVEGALGHVREFLDVVGDAAAGAAQRETRPQDHRQADLDGGLEAPRRRS